MRFFLTFFFLCMFSCMQDNSDTESSENFSSELSNKSLEYIWICHHPDSRYHNQVCVEEVYPDGCYVLGDRTKFCWILNKEDCEGKLSEDWQIKNCPKLTGK